MSNPVVAFDEAGNTGQNLLDSVQPSFVLASVHMSNAEVAEIRSALEIPCGDEIHFVNLKRSREGRRRILQALDSGVFAPDNTKTCIYHKRFMIVAKAVDILVESLMHEAGINLYEHARNLALTNFIYAKAPHFCSETTWNVFLNRFVAMIREKSAEHISAFYDATDVLIAACHDEQFKEVLLPFLWSNAIIDDVMELVDVTDLDPAVPAFVTLAIRWSEKFGRAFDIMHDTSKPIAHQQEIIECLMSLDGPSVEVGYGNRTGTYPIRATGINFCESHADMQVQVADLIGGATAYVSSGLCDPSRQDQFWKDLNSTGWLDSVTDTVWPTGDVTPEALGATSTDCVDPVEYCARIIGRRQLENSGE